MGGALMQLVAALKMFILTGNPSNHILEGHLPTPHKLRDGVN